MKYSWQLQWTLPTSRRAHAPFIVTAVIPQPCVGCWSALRTHCICGCCQAVISMPEQKQRMDLEQGQSGSSSQQEGVLLLR